MDVAGSEVRQILCVVRANSRGRDEERLDKVVPQAGCYSLGRTEKISGCMMVLILVSVPGN